MRRNATAEPEVPPYELHYAGDLTIRHYANPPTDIPSEARAAVATLTWQIGFNQTERISRPSTANQQGMRNEEVVFFRVIGHGSTRELAKEMASKNPARKLAKATEDA